jgi:hypothetical protein
MNKTTTVEYSQPKGTYYSVLSDGKFHTTVEKDTPGAVLREYETSDGKKGSKHELVAQSITGKITNVSIYDGDFGKSVQVTLGDNELILALSTNSNFGEDMMKKLPNIDVTKDVKFSPYSFEDEKGKKRKGLTIYQDGNKIADYYHEKKGDKIVEINGYPKVPKESKDWDKDQWKLYFATARIFLTKEVEKNAMYNKATLATSNSVEYPKDTISPDDIGF